MRRFEVPTFTEDQKREMREAAKRDEQIAKIEQYTKRINESGLPAEYAKESLKGILPFAKNYADEVKEGSSKWLLLKGENGRGKTHQACLAMRLIAQSMRVKFSTMGNILDECIDGVSNRDRRMLNVKNSYVRVPFLVIDDFGKENPTDFSLSLIFDLIDGRMKNQKPTIVTTNMNANELCAHMTKKYQDKSLAQSEVQIAKSVVSRLACAEVHVIEGKDWRLHG